MTALSRLTSIANMGCGTLLRLVFAAFVCLASGCTTIHGTPVPYQTSASIVEKINLTADDLAELQAATTRSERNRVQRKAIAVIDQWFSQFVLDLAANRADSTAAAAGTTLAASTAGAFVESVRAKTNYALFAAGIVGAFGIVDKTYFYDKTVTALISAMGASRARVLLKIRSSQREDIDTYDGTAALADLNTYYLAGTVTMAISEVTQKAETDKEVSLDRIRVLEVPSDAEVAVRRSTRDAIWAIDDAALDKAKKATSALKLPDPKSADEARTALLNEYRGGTAARRSEVEKALKAAGLLK